MNANFRHSTATIAIMKKTEKQEGKKEKRK